MTPDAALDNLAFFVALRLMGPDARRRLRLTLMRHPDVAAPVDGTVRRLEHLEGLLEGSIQPATLQDRLDLDRAQRERTAEPFDACFWLARSAELMSAGFTPVQAMKIVDEVRGRVDPEQAAAAEQEEEEEHAG